MNLQKTIVLLSFFIFIIGSQILGTQIFVIPLSIIFFLFSKKQNFPKLSFLLLPIFLVLISYFSLFFRGYDLLESIRILQFFFGFFLFSFIFRTIRIPFWVVPLSFLFWSLLELSCVFLYGKSPDYLMNSFGDDIDGPKCLTKPP